jgi:hypothetical protein
LIPSPSAKAIVLPVKKEATATNISCNQRDFVWNFEKYDVTTEAFKVNPLLDVQAFKIDKFL